MPPLRRRRMRERGGARRAAGAEVGLGKMHVGPALVAPEMTAPVVEPHGLARGGVAFGDHEVPVVVPVDIRGEDPDAEGAGRQHEGKPFRGPAELDLDPVAPSFEPTRGPLGKVVAVEVRQDPGAKEPRRVRVFGAGTCQRRVGPIPAQRHAEDERRNEKMLRVESLQFRLRRQLSHNASEDVNSPWNARYRTGGTTSASIKTTSPSRIMPRISGRMWRSLSSESTTLMVTGRSSLMPNSRLRCTLRWLPKPMI